MRGVVLFGLIACGDNLVPVVPDVPFPEGPAELVQAIETAVTIGERTSVAIAPTRAHSLLVAVVATEGTARVRSVSAGVRVLELDFPSLFLDCDRDLEVWSLGDVEAGVTSIDVELSGSMSIAVYALEIAGVSRFPIVNSRNLGGTTFDLTFEATTESALVATIVGCGGVTELAPGSSFIGFTPQLGSAVAYLVPTAPGEYGVQWTVEGTAFQTLNLYR